VDYLGALLVMGGPLLFLQAVLLFLVSAFAFPEWNGAWFATLMRKVSPAVLYRHHFASAGVLGSLPRT
jgi:hypothetical protein